MKTLNNESKHYFAKFLSIYGLKRDNSTRRQVFFDKSGLKFSFSVSNNPDILECRQLYEDCHGFVTYHIQTETFYRVNVDRPSSFTYSRTTRTGIQAFSAKVKLDSAIEIGTMKNQDLLETTCQKPKSKRSRNSTSSIPIQKLRNDALTLFCRSWSRILSGLSRAPGTVRSIFR